MASKFKIPDEDDIDESPAPKVKSLFRASKTGENTSSISLNKPGPSATLQKTGVIEKTTAKDSSKTDENPSSISINKPGPSTTLQRMGLVEKTTAKVDVNFSSASTSANYAQKRKLHRPNAILVSERQRGNPLLQSIKMVPWEYGELTPDYQMGDAACAIFLSLKYHSIYPQYIYERLKAVGKTYKLQVLLLLIDIKDPDSFLKELAKVAILADCTLICCWSYEEAGEVIQSYKLFEHKSPQIIMEKQTTDSNDGGTSNRYRSAFEALASVKTINKTDAVSLISTFGTMESIIKASPEQISLCTGLGPQKGENLYKLFRRPFKRS